MFVFVSVFRVLDRVRVFLFGVLLVLHLQAVVYLYAGLCMHHPFNQLFFLLMIFFFSSPPPSLLPPLDTFQDEAQSHRRLRHHDVYDVVAARG